MFGWSTRKRLVRDPIADDMADMGRETPVPLRLSSMKEETWLRDPINLQCPSYLV